MANGEPPCDAACRAKLILDGDNISSLAENLCKRIEASGDPIKNGQKIATIFAAVEDELCKAQRLFIDGTGYDGPLPKMLS